MFQARDPDEILNPTIEDSLDIENESGSGAVVIIVVVIILIVVIIVVVIIVMRFKKRQPEICVHD